MVMTIVDDMAPEAQTAVRRSGSKFFQQVYLAVSAYREASSQVILDKNRVID
jgi:hypothetical protein